MEESFWPLFHVNFSFDFDHLLSSAGIEIYTSCVPKLEYTEMKFD